MKHKFDTVQNPAAPVARQSYTTNSAQAVSTPSLPSANPSPSDDTKKQPESSVSLGRQMEIVSVIRNARIATIKDISSHFPEVSEKTIQRDLQALVSRSLIKKSGERRWARYSLTA
jgi:predicted HTH transcriptional regulator